MSRSFLTPLSPLLYTDKKHICSHESLYCSWVDVDTRAYVAPIAGVSALPQSVYYRIPAAPPASDVARIKADVASTFPNDLPFTWVFALYCPSVALQKSQHSALSLCSPAVIAVFTWFAVGRYSARADNLNTFQAVLASDPSSSRSYITFCYDNLVFDFGDGACRSLVLQYSRGWCRRLVSPHRQHPLSSPPLLLYQYQLARSRILASTLATGLATTPCPGRSLPR